MKAILTFLTSSIIFGVFCMPNTGNAITRDEVIATAEAYASHSWYCSASNSSTCTSNSCTVSSPLSIGLQTGVAYKWGGFDSISGFDSNLSLGFTAGDVSTSCVADCATGVDCSGYVSRCWGVSTKYGTSTLPNISTPIPQSDMQKGDIFNYPNNHVVILDYFYSDGRPVIYEATPNKVIHRVVDWSYLNGYTQEIQQY